MNLSWWADIAGLVSFVLSIPAYWALLTEKGRAIMSGRKWILPCLFSIAIAVAGLHLLIILGVIGRPSPTFDEEIPLATTEMKQIKNRNYTNETVHLDGIEFVDCNFDNVTFEYDGRAPFRMIDGAVRGHSRFRSRNRSIYGTLSFFYAMGALKIGPNLPWDIEFNQQ